MKKIFLILLLLSTTSFGQLFELGTARGLFFSIGVGPRLPIGDFSLTHTLGSGVDAAIAYSDNSIIPLFFYGKLGFQHFPGNITYYKKSNYATISEDAYSMQLGSRFYLPPLVSDQFLLMPVIEGGFSFSIFEKWHEFIPTSPKSNFTETISKTGFHIGVGLSMFLMDMMGYYNYYYKNQYIYIDLRIRIPIFVKI